MKIKNIDTSRVKNHKFFELHAVKAVNFVMAAVWIAFLAGVSAAAVKYVAVVETDIDTRSGAAADFKPYDGLKFAVFPTESGAFKVLARYDYSF